MVREARKLFGGLPQFRYAVADVQELPLGDAADDVVIANQMLSHAPSPMGAVADLRRVLKPSGRLYVGASGREHMAEITLLHEFDARLPRYDRTVPMFPLEKIEAEWSPWFGGIGVERFERTLRVTEAEPLVAYAYSMSDLWAPATDRRDHLHRFVRARLARDGVIRLTSITGIVTASPRDL